MAEHVWEARRGGLNPLTRTELRDRFAGYFSSVHYTVWDDLQPPHVAISEDGMSAWMAVEIEAKLTVTGDDGLSHEVAFESSWISVYEKQDGEWRMAGIASSVVERG